VLSAIVWLPYGLYCLVAPGALAGAALLHSGLIPAALPTLAVLCGGLGFGRLIGIALDGGLSGYTVGGLAVELGSVAAGALCLWRLGGVART
jgi:hypothetical protein